MATTAPAGTEAYERASLPASSTPWREAELSVVDLELTGLDPAEHEIISFAVVRISSGRIRLSDTLYRTVRPRHMPGAETIRIHGLRESDLAGAPALPEVLGDLLAALGGTVLVAHAAAIEKGFLGAALGENGVALRNPVLDTAALARRLPGQRRPQALADLARSLGLPIHRPHHAEGDALTTAQVFLALAAHLEETERPLTIGKLQRISERGGAPSILDRVRALLSR